MSAPRTTRHPLLSQALATARHLSTPEAGGLGQGVRFALAGGTVMVVYLSTTTVLAQVFGVPFQIALVVGYCLGLCVHFTLQRVFVWKHHEEFVLSIHQQARRYLLVASLQYGVTAASTAELPGALGVSSEAVYLVTVFAVTATNFLVFRTRVFHGGPARGDHPADASGVVAPSVLSAEARPVRTAEDGASEPRLSRLD